MRPLGSPLFVLLKSAALILVWGYVSKDAQTKHEGQRIIFPTKPSLTQRVPRQRYGRTIHTHTHRYPSLNDGDTFWEMRR